jgi:hypothetical protein
MYVDIRWIPYAPLSILPSEIFLVDLQVGVLGGFVVFMVLHFLDDGHNQRDGHGTTGKNSVLLPLDGGYTHG